MNNFKIMMLSLMVFLTIFPLSCFALTYRTDFNNGTWNAYKSGFDSSYYLSDLYQSTYNRNFETDFSFSGVETSKCTGEICYIGSHLSSSLERSNTTAQEGTYSAKIIHSGFQETTIFGLHELTGDTNINFYYKKASGTVKSNLSYGYVKDANSYVELGSFSDDQANWTYFSYTIPKGAYRFAIRTGGGNDVSTTYIDNLKVGRTNAGTFRKTNNTPNCSTIQGCNNITELKNNAERRLYFIADYLAGGSCTYNINGVNKGNMTYMTNGMYYGLIDTYGTLAGVDVNVSATCIKTGVDSKSFWADGNVSIDNNISTSISVGNTGVSNYGIKGDAITFYSIYRNDLNQVITDANCTLDISGVDKNLTYNAINSRHEVSYTFASNGTYVIDHNCTKTNFQSSASSYNFYVQDALTDSIEFTPIQNISSYTLSDYVKQITFSPINNNDDMIFKISATDNFANLVLSFSNNDVSTKQYFVYTSTNGTNWSFADTLTFGATNDTPIQKIWNYSNKTFDYNITDSLSTEEVKYYKLSYFAPPKAWQTIQNTNDWVKVNQPSLYSEGDDKHYYDLYQDSNYSPIQNYTTNYLSQLTSSDLNAGFMLQFTAYSSVNTTLAVGYRVGSTDTTTNLTITPTKKRFSVFINPNDFESKLLIKTTGATNGQVYLSDYAIIPRSYFTERLEVYNIDGGVLKAILKSGTVYQYIQEGSKYLAKTQLGDISGDVSYIIVQALINNVVLKSQVIDLKDLAKQGAVININQDFDPIVDLNGTATNPSALRPITIKATLYNSANQSVAEQHKTIYLLQYPYFQTDLQQNVSSLTAQVGENPKFNWSLNQKDPSQFIGLKVVIYDVNKSITNNEYSKTIYQKDLSCSYDCQKTFTFDDWVYKSQIPYRVAFIALTSTENENYNNSLIMRYVDVFAKYKEFDTKRLFQVFERTDHNYRIDEPIPLVLQMRDVPYKNLSKDIKVELQVNICGGSAPTDPCGAVLTNQFFPQKFYYDETTGYNYWLWDQIFYQDDGSLMPDGNYLKFIANITDLKGGYNTATIGNSITLADKCKDANYGTKFLNGSFIMNYVDSFFNTAERALFGCKTSASNTVIIGDAEEKRIFMSATHTVSAGQNQSVACLKLDNNNFLNASNQDLICAVFYKRGEQPIDRFDFYLTNNNTDYLLTGGEAQYLNFSVAGTDLLLNDPLMIQKALQLEYSTDSIDTVGEVVLYGFDKLFSAVANPLTDVALEGTTKTGLITNVGFDINWDNTFDPNYVNGLFFVKLQGVPIINAFDYSIDHPEVKNMNLKYFKKYALEKKIKVPSKSSKIIIYGNDFNPFIEQELSGSLVIYAEPSKATYNTEDANKAGQTVPTVIKLNFVSDMVSNNEQSAQRVFLPLTFSYIIPNPPFSLSGFLNGENGILTNPVGFVMNNWFILLLGVIAILILSLIVRNFRSGGGKIPVVGDIWDNRLTNTQEFKNFKDRGY